MQIMEYPHLCSEAALGLRVGIRSLSLPSERRPRKPFGSVEGALTRCRATVRYAQKLDV